MQLAAACWITAGEIYAHRLHATLGLDIQPVNRVVWLVGLLLCAALFLLADAFINLAPTLSRAGLYKARQAISRSTRAVLLVAWMTLAVLLLGGMYLGLS